MQLEFFPSRTIALYLARLFATRIVGVLLIGVINNGLSLMGAQTYWQYIVQGLLLIVAMFAAGVISLRRH